MQMGTPVLTSNISSMPEAGGDAACLVDPREVEDIAAGLEKLLTNEQLRQDHIQKGRLHASRFTAERMARQTLAVYRKFS
jgi:glycosyltransferase involved in cell wall biosynthesis